MRGSRSNATGVDRLVLLPRLLRHATEGSSGTSFREQLASNPRQTRQECSRGLRRKQGPKFPHCSFFGHNLVRSLPNRVTAVAERKLFLTKPLRTEYRHPIVDVGTALLPRHSPGMLEDEPVINARTELVRIVQRRVRRESDGSRSCDKKPPLVIVYDQLVFSALVFFSV